MNGHEHGAEEPDIYHCALIFSKLYIEKKSTSDVKIIYKVILPS
jgi:hypothetical protein